ncbi:hypothetical protein BTJ40_06805 [Microbulbifer sp. A4B17]|uniref:hypothetical protein n=1 Tax=Microbulbifer sp. A4B17 TaxID=359370 RepID=UPI000D52F0AA|nr:hypothetical protein [Microbulbifer sp. A4B17]AWF80540.1 hypothetical protein BTJ40_06805 [Microbulbifer sp. A4B17]
MKILTILFLLLLSSFGLACPVEKANIVGVYSYQSGVIFYQEFQLSENDEFNSWLNNRLDSSGTWGLDVCTVKIKLRAQNDIVEFKIIESTPTQITVIFKGYETISVFKKSK